MTWIEGERVNSLTIPQIEQVHVPNKINEGINNQYQIYTPQNL